MARFFIRAWQTQTLYDAREHWIEADSPEDAARIYRDEIDAMEAGDANAGEARDADGRHFLLPDPEEIVDSDRGYVLLDETWTKVRDVDPDADEHVPAYNRIAAWSAEDEMRRLLRDCRTLIDEWQTNHVWDVHSADDVPADCPSVTLLREIDALLNPGGAG